MADSSSSVAELIGKLASHDAVARQQAREQLVTVGEPAVPGLVAALDDKHKQVRWEAAKTLEGIASPAAASKLAETLGDEESDVRWVAGEALIALKRLGLVPLFDTISTKPDSSWMFDGAHHVLRELSKDQDLKPVIKPVLDALSSPAIDEREIAVPVAAQKAAGQLRGL